MCFPPPCFRESLKSTDFVAYFFVFHATDQNCRRKENSFRSIELSSAKSKFPPLEILARKSVWFFRIVHFPHIHDDRRISTKLQSVAKVTGLLFSPKKNWWSIDVKGRGAVCYAWARVQEGNYGRDLALAKWLNLRSERPITQRIASRKNDQALSFSHARFILRGKVKDKTKIHFNSFVYYFPAKDWNLRLEKCIRASSFV